MLNQKHYNEETTEEEKLEFFRQWFKHKKRTRLQARFQTQKDLLISFLENNKYAGFPNKKIALNAIKEFLIEYNAIYGR